MSIDDKDESKSSNWGAFFSSVLVAAFQTAVIILLSVNIGWLSLISPSVLDKLLPHDAADYPDNCKTPCCSDQQVRNMRENGFASDGNARFISDRCQTQSTSTMITRGLCSDNTNKSAKVNIPRIGCKPYCWRSNKATPHFDGVFYSSGFEAWGGEMMFTAYSYFRMMLAKIINLGGLTETLSPTPLQPLLTALSFFISSHIVWIAAGVLSVAGAAVASGKVPYEGTFGQEPDSILQALWNFMGFIMCWGVWLPCAIYNCFYMFFCVFLWVVFVAPMKYSSSGDLIRIMRCHQETYGVIFLGLVLIYGSNALSNDISTAFIVSYVIYLAIFAYRKI